MGHVQSHQVMGNSAAQVSSRGFVTRWFHFINTCTFSMRHKVVVVRDTRWIFCRNLLTRSRQSVTADGGALSHENVWKTRTWRTQEDRAVARCDFDRKWSVTRMRLLVILHSFGARRIRKWVLLTFFLLGARKTPRRRSWGANATSVRRQEICAVRAF